MAGKARLVNALEKDYKNPYTSLTVIRTSIELLRQKICFLSLFNGISNPNFGLSIICTVNTIECILTRCQNGVILCLVTQRQNKRIGGYNHEEKYWQCTCTISNTSCSNRSDGWREINLDISSAYWNYRTRQSISESKGRI